MKFGKGISILYVDDEESLLEVCKQYLEMTGDVRVQTELSVKEAEDALDAEQFDAVISDYQMPEMSGLDFLKRLRAKGNDIPFILFTGKGREEVVIEAINSGADSYLQKGGDPRVQFLELGHQVKKAVAKRRADRSLKESEERYRMLFEGIQEGMAFCEMVYDEDGTPVDWRYLKVNAQFTALTGLRDIEGKKVSEAIPGILERDPDLIVVYNRVATTGDSEKIETYVNSIGQWLDISVISPSRGYFSAIFENVTERKRDEQEREMTIEILNLLNRSKNVDELVRSAITFFQQRSGCDAVKVRLTDGVDYSIHGDTCSPDKQVQKGTRACSYDERSNTCVDREGLPINECVCRNVVCGQFDPAKGYFTTKGSFWTNCVSELIARCPELDRQANSRNRIGGEGYESAALIPLFLGEDRFGILQMNDRRCDAYSPHLVAQWERLAGYLSVALSKFLTDEALRESEERYRSLFETIRETAVFFEYVLDENDEVIDFTCRDINPAGLEMLGYESKDEAVGKRMGRYSPGRSVLPSLKSVLQMRDTGTPFLNDFHLDVTDRDYITAILPVDKYHFILTCRDESEIKGMQRAADAAASRLRAIMDVLPIGLITTNEKGGMISFNDIAKRIWGGNVPMVENTEGYRDYKAWWHDTGVEVRSDEWGAAIALKEGRTVLGQIVNIQGFDGVRRWIVNSAAPIRTNSGKIAGAVAALQDITESVAQEESLRIANGKLKLLDSINRHDIKNQLLILRSNLELLRRSVTGPEDVKRLESMERSAAMIEKQINFAKQYQELGRTSPVWQSLTKELTKTYNGYFSVELSMCIDDCLGIEVLADPLLPKVFHNLMENTLRYGNRPGRIDVHCERCGPDLLIVYEDQGQGISEEEKGRVFEKGFGKGTGLGLFLIREILGITGIEIRENGVPGQGIRFEMRVPQGRFRFVDQPSSQA